MACVDDPALFVYIPFEPDLEGYGIIGVFVFNAIISSLTVILHFIATASSEERHSLHKNPIDTRIKAWFVRHSLGKKISRSMTPVLERTALVLSDTQLVTGLAVLVSAWVQISHIPLRHWRIAVALAWLASVTHLATLTTLRGYFREHRISRTVRITLIFILLLMLMISILPTASQSNVEIASCFWNRLILGQLATANSGIGSAILSMVFLLLSILIRIIKLTNTGSLWARTHLRANPGRRIRASLYLLDRHSVSRPLFLCSIPVFQTIELLADLWESVLFEAYLLFHAVGWGIGLVLFRGKQRHGNRWNPINLARDKILDIVAEPPKVVLPAHTTWNFGQIIPICLLMLPVLGVFEIWSELGSDSKANESESGVYPSMRSNEPGLSGSNAVSAPSSRPVLSTPLSMRQIRSSRSSRPTLWLQTEIYAGNYWKIQVFFCLASGTLNIVFYLYRSSIISIYSQTPTISNIGFLESVEIAGLAFTTAIGACVFVSSVAALPKLWHRFVYPIAWIMTLVLLAVLSVGEYILYETSFLRLNNPEAGFAFSAIATDEINYLVMKDEHGAGWIRKVTVIGTKAYG